ncbi:hypothetical protein Tco_0084568 [Tanacetum coccineum]
MAELILNEALAKQNLAEPSVESNMKYEFSEELLKELRRNTYCGRVEEDVVGHIAKILKILDLIKIADVDPFQLRMKIFPSKFLGTQENVEKLKNGGTVKEQLLLGRNWAINSSINNTHCSIPTKVKFQMTWTTERITLNFYIGWHQNLTTTGN